jgi:hypothetical protein
MNDDRVDPNIFEEHHIESKISFQTLFLHGASPILDHKGLVREPTDVRERLHQNFGLINRGFHLLISSIFQKGL